MGTTTIVTLSTPTLAADAPYTFSLLATGDDATDPGVFLPLLSNIPFGPLYELLARTSDWAAAFNLGGTQCGRIHVRSRMANSTLVNASEVNLQWTNNAIPGGPNAITAGVEGPAGGMGAIIFEIRLSQSERL
jgi:hypothetical protein